ncbi:alpha/beta fold hydrolase [bacterium]|nr:alpha/beta fold hydrolase [bacterium]
MVNGTRVRAWLYPLANGAAPAPCVVMAHGLGGVKAMGLDRYARRFHSAGFAVLVFDYRFWGESEGNPRHLAWIPHQLTDWADAVKYARSRPEVDSQRIILWGTSLSGGHVIATAAADPAIAAVIAQCPALDGHVALEEMMHRQGMGAINWGVIPHAQRDLVRSWLGLSAHKVPIVGPAGSIALMPLPEAVDAFAELAPSDFVNEVCARIAVRIDKYRPVQQANKIRCPVLLQICEHDPVTPPGVVEDANRRLGARAKIARYPIGHFDIYQGAHFEHAVADQVQFLSKIPSLQPNTPVLHSKSST